jgi:hypothetical protein
MEVIRETSVSESRALKILSRFLVEQQDKLQHFTDTDPQRADVFVYLQTLQQAIQQQAAPQDGADA